ncbi:phosphatase PAP2 family protein [bacterium]|nr:MAG: phosphatase PAP2 family protein [bacterium]RIK62465.1 MAG: hypothetical protein DCC64_10310 [Planctomycetota bacterium]
MGKMYTAWRQSPADSYNIAMRELDRQASRPIHALSLGLLDYLLAVPGMMFGSYFMPVTLSLVGVLLGWKFTLVGLAACLATLAITDPLKHWAARQRPQPLEAPRRVAIRTLVRNPSFPSGDSAQAAMIATMLWLNAPLEGWVRHLLLLIAPACMFARVYFGAHWVGDTLAGAAIGAAVWFVFQGLFSDFLAA